MEESDFCASWTLDNIAIVKLTLNLLLIEAYLRNLISLDSIRKSHHQPSFHIYIRFTAQEGGDARYSGIAPFQTGIASPPK
jgi:hypothetical protein